MGFFFTNYKPQVKAIKEAEIDGQPGGEETTPDYSAEDQAAEAPAEQQTAQEVPPEDQQATTGDQAPAEGGEEPVDYTQMDADQEAQAQEVPSEDGGEGGAADAGGGAAAAPANGPQQPSEVDEHKAQEEDDLYEDLTPEQLDIKHKELKNRYLEMFDTVTSVIDRIGDVSVAEENLEIITYVSNTLSGLRDMLTDYINSVYKTKSYIENLVNYNKFLAVLNGINEILEEMNKKGE